MEIDVLKTESSRRGLPRANVAGETLHAKSGREAQHFHADMTRADDPQGLALEFETAQRLVGKGAPMQALHGFAQPPRQRQHQGESMLRHRLVSIGGNVAYGDSAARACLKIDMIEGGRARGYKPQPGVGVQKLSAHREADENGKNF